MITGYRQRSILDILTQQGSVHTGALAEILQVSPMTVHRVLDQLERAGQLRKVRGGALPVTPSVEASGVCVACYAPLSPRTQVVLPLADGSQRRACCPHCGLMALRLWQDSVSAFLVTGKLRGRVVNGRTATFLDSPTESVCCTPTVLAFESAEDAQRFQTGFGGQLLNLDEALTFLQAEMHL